MTNVCVSGGADGADLQWKLTAKKFDHKTFDYIFKGKPVKEPADKSVELPSKLLLKADPMLKKANKYLKRRYPTSNLFVNQLLRRNYYVVNDVDKLYAIGWIEGDPLTITEATRSINGGTAWGCQLYVMSRLQQMKYIEMYFFDQNTNMWYKYDIRNMWAKMEVPPPIPQGLYAGIGSLDLTDEGKNAIHNVFDQ